MKGINLVLDDNGKEKNGDFDSYEEILTSKKDISAGHSYTIARVVENGYCVELHYCSDTCATVEYGTKISNDCWKNEVVDVDWFNTNLSDEQILNKLNYLYDEKFVGEKSYKRYINKHKKICSKDEMEM